MEIYLPNDSTFNKCYELRQDGVIRGYDHVPAYNTNYTYRDYYINTSYAYKDGTGSWSSYTGNLPTCINESITHNIMYAKNMDLVIPIVIIALMFAIIIIQGLFDRWFSK